MRGVFAGGGDGVVADAVALVRGPCDEDALDAALAAAGADGARAGRATTSSKPCDGGGDGEPHLLDLARVLDQPQLGQRARSARRPRARPVLGSCAALSRAVLDRGVDGLGRPRGQRGSSRRPIRRRRRRPCAARRAARRGARGADARCAPRPRPASGGRRPRTRRSGRRRRTPRCRGRRSGRKYRRRVARRRRRRVRRARSTSTASGSWSVPRPVRWANAECGAEAVVGVVASGP